jgi:hypothetical protein
MAGFDTTVNLIASGALALPRLGPAHGARAYPPSGMADPEGFAAMGCAEALLHGHDIARGLSLSLDPPRGTCSAVLGRLFPQAAADLAGLGPWAALQWATGRAELPGHPQLRQWHWRGPPLER